MKRFPPRKIWMWQNIISPHMAGLAMAMARLGCEVTYLAEQTLTADRVELGWSPPPLDGVRFELVQSAATVSKLVASAPSDSIHVCSGIRSNGLIGLAQSALARRQLRQWIVMETVEDVGWRGALKRLEYSRLFMRRRHQVQGVLGIGHSTPAWIAARGMPNPKVFPFAYFLPNLAHTSNALVAPERFRFLFVGQFIALKRLGLLIDGLGRLSSFDFELAVVGSGPMEVELRTLADATLPGKVDWIARLPLESVPQEMARANCLVLPSRHDGWGAVVSEALMVGTPVICSDACGSAGVVRASGYGGVFRSGNRDELMQLLNAVMAKGRLALSDRQSLAGWAECLGGNAGAEYLMQILDHAEGRAERPAPPWELHSARPCAEARHGH